jgi:hypothetical protein
MNRFQTCFEYQLAPLQQGAGRVRELLPGQLGEAVQVDSIKTRVESVPGFST